jgi:hypothetical protein
MAKGLRSSVKKTNRTKLRARVFEPVENARLERLHQKLLETAQQSKPEDPKKNDMDVDSEGNSATALEARPLSNTPRSDATAANDASNEDEFSKGLSFLSARIPRSLHAGPSSNAPTTDPAKHDNDNSGFYHLLGLCSDVVGFTRDGALEFAFDPHTPHWLSEQGLTVTS